MKHKPELPGQPRRHLTASFLTSLALCLMIAIGSPPVFAATLTIETEIAEIDADGDCSLHEAIVNIRTGTQVLADCPAPSPSGDTIDLNGLTVTIRTPLDGPSGYALNLGPPLLIIGGDGGAIRHVNCDPDDAGGVLFRLFTLVGTDLTIEDTSLRGGCLVGANGGGVALTGGSLTLRNTTMSFNRAARGAAIHNTGGNVTIVGSTLSRNEASDDGGAIFDDGGSLRIVNTTLSGNTAGDNGGALMVNNGSSDVRITNGTLYGNTAGRWGGGIIIGSSGGSIELDNATITNNTATTLGGGLYRNSGSYDISNSIISGNVAASDDECGGSYSSSPARRSLLGFNGDNGGCSGFLTAPGSFTPAGQLGTIFEVNGSDVPILAANGGVTDTVALVQFSAAFGRGSNALLPDEASLGVDVDGDGNTTDNPIEADQRGAGFPRILGAVDVGAYEINCNGYGFPYVLGSVNSDLVEDLRQAFFCANANGSADTIDFDGQTVTFSGPHEALDFEGFNALPRVAGLTTLTLENGTIERDASLTECDGGAGDRTEFRLLYVDQQATLTMRRMTLRNGCASDVNGDLFDARGGGVHNDGVLRVIESRFENNRGEGSAVFNRRTATIANSSFMGNQGAAAILTQGSSGTTTLVNSTMTSGSSLFSLANGETIVINTTINENSRGLQAQAGGTFSVHNVILANNGGSNCDGGGITSSHSYSDDNTCNFTSSNGRDDADIALGVLNTASNGTSFFPLLHGHPGNGGSNALLPSEASLGIDVNGDGDQIDNPIEADQRGSGFPRILDGLVDAGSHETDCFEYNFPYTIGDVNPDLVADLREAMQCVNGETIDLDGQTLTFVDAFDDFSGATALPSVATTIRLVNGTLRSSVNAYRFLHVAGAGHLLLEDVTLENGGAATIQGGGVYVEASGSLSVLDTTLSNLTASGAGAIFSSGNATIANSSFDSNSAVGDGGAIAVDSGALNIVNSTFVGNQAGGLGGALFGENAASITLDNATIAGNSATSGGGGIGRGAGVFDVRNTIISGNMAAAGGDECDGDWSSSLARGSILGHSGSHGGCTGFGTSSGNTTPTGGLDSILATAAGIPVLANNGGTTSTVALVSGSPALGHGDNTLLPDESVLGLDLDGDGTTADDPIEVDQRGMAFPRVIFTTVDAGAYEGGCGVAFPHTMGTNSADPATHLRDVVDCANANNNDSTTVDVIDLSGQTVVFTSALPAHDGFGYNALPLITDSLRLQNGTLERSTSLDECVVDLALDRTQFRLLASGNGTVNIYLDQMVFFNGCSSGTAGVSGGANGGAVYFFSDTLYVTNSHFRSNWTLGDSGALEVVDADMVLANSSFVSNVGGSVAQRQGGNTTIFNSTLTRSQGPFAISSRGSMVVINSTISRNTTIGIDNASGSMRVFNSILSDNSGANCGVAFTESGSSYSDDGTCNFAASGGADGAAIPLGPRTQAANGTDYYPLLPGIAQDGGDNDLLPDESSLGLDIDGDGLMDDPIDVDQRGTGFERVGFGATVDAGAYEVNCDAYAYPYLVGTVTDNLPIDLRQAVECANETATDDTIDLDGQIVTFSDAPAAYDAQGHNALETLPPTASSGSLTLRNGTIERDSSLIACNGGSGDRTEFRLLSTELGSSLALDHLLVRNGCASNVSGSGFDDRGGVVYALGEVTVRGSHFESNTAHTGSAISTQKPLIVANSSFVSNAGRGAIATLGPTTNTTVLNSTIGGQVSLGGGQLGSALYTSSGTCRVVNGTISGNSTGVDNLFSTTTLDNTIVSNSSSDNCLSNRGSINGSHSFSDDGTCGFAVGGGTDNAAVSLSPLAVGSNGTRYFPLLGGSLLNGGDNALLPNESTLGIDVDDDNVVDDPIDVDQRGSGHTRIQIGTVDAGAHEVVMGELQPGFTKVFAPDSIVVGGVSTLTFSIANPYPFLLANLAFNDDLPAGMSVATPPMTVTSCGGSVSASAGGTTVGFSGGTVGGSSNCTVSVDVTSNTPGEHVNVSSALTSDAGTAGTASDALTVAQPPAFAKVFTPDAIFNGGTTTLTFTIDNSANVIAVGSLDFTDNLPAGMSVASPANASSSCTSGTITAVPGTAIITFDSGGSVMPGSSCLVEVEVTSSTAGVHVNTTGDLTSDVGNSGSASDTLTVGVVIDVTSPIDDLTAGDGLCTLREAIRNANADADLTAGDCPPGSGADVIRLPAATYLLSIVGTDEDLALSGDLDVTDSAGLLILGDGARTTLIDAGGSDRIFDLQSGAALDLDGLTIQGGSLSPPPVSFAENPSKASGEKSLGDGGGGIRSAGTLDLTEIRIHGNASPGSGGGLRIDGGSASIRYCLFDANLAHTDASATGGGLFVGSAASVVAIEHSTFSGNVAEPGVGGALSHSGDQPVELRYVTVVDNSSGLDRTGLGTLSFTASIVTQNGGVDCSGGPVSEDYNVVGDSGDARGCPSDGSNDLVPALGDGPVVEANLTDNGGPTDTRGVFFGSLARDHIPAGAVGCNTTDTRDQRGLPRPDGSGCDVGAYEGFEVPVELLSFQIE